MFPRMPIALHNRNEGKKPDVRRVIVILSSTPLHTSRTLITSTGYHQRCARRPFNVCIDAVDVVDCTVHTYGGVPDAHWRYIVWYAQYLTET